MSESTQDDIVVSICCATYNHEKYLRDAIESFLMQETDFPIEILIHDDASTDNTPAIIREYAEKYPKLIIPVFQSENQYSQGKRIIGNFLLPRARGKYIAICEGDDYWTSPHKLQRQVDYMETHPECRICFHTAKMIYEDEPGKTHIVRPNPMPLPDQPVSVLSWQKRLFIMTGTVVYRPVNESLPPWYFEMRNAGDWPLFIWLLLHGGEIRFLDEPEPMAVYRKCSAGVSYPSSIIGSSGRQRRLLDSLDDVTLVRTVLKGGQRKWLHPRFFALHFALTNEYLLSSNYAEARHHLVRSIFYLPFALLAQKEYLRVFALAIRCYCPKLYLALIDLKSRFKKAYKSLHAQTN